MNQQNKDTELATFTLLNPDFIIQTVKQAEETKKDEKQTEI